MIRECETPKWYFNCKDLDAKCFDQDFYEMTGRKVGKLHLRDTDLCYGCKFNNCITDEVENKLEINDCGVVVDGFEEAFSYKSKDYEITYMIADFGDYWGVGYNWDDRKEWSGGGSPITECDVLLNLRSREEAIDHMIIFLKGNVPERKKEEINKLIINIKTPQLTLF